MHPKISLALALGALAVPAGAQAHVSLHPNTLPTGSGPTVDVRVPNETSNARTVKVDVKIPPGFTLLMPAPVPGWTPRVIHQKLAKPIKTDDGIVTEQASEVIWTADKGQGTPPDEFQAFPLLMGIPGKAGQVLTFKTVQTYSNGQVVRWIDAPAGDKPAPTVNVTADGGFLREQAGDAGPPAPSASSVADQGKTPAKPTVIRQTVTKSGGAAKGLAIAALVLGALGLLTGTVALMARRRTGVPAA
jgi:uncharacterized protein YcnI